MRFIPRCGSQNPGSKARNYCRFARRLTDAKAREQRWHPRSLAGGKYREFQGLSTKPLKSRENPDSPGKPF